MCTCYSLHCKTYTVSDGLTRPYFLLNLLTKPTTDNFFQPVPQIAIYFKDVQLQVCYLLTALKLSPRYTAVASPRQLYNSIAILLRSITMLLSLYSSQVHLPVMKPQHSLTVPSVTVKSPGNTCLPGCPGVCITMHRMDIAHRPTPSSTADFLIIIRNLSSIMPMLASCVFAMTSYFL